MANLNVEHDTVFKVGDVVFADGASAIIGDVISVEPPDYDQQSVVVRWRSCETTEGSDDLVLVERKED